ncbi:MAG TPA: hypothetical protein VJR29_02835 [bacterium]|nr:hypothetical protein [bacterium]
MGPKADDTQTNDDEWVGPAVLSKGQRLLYGAAPQSAAVMDPNADPVMLSLPNGGSLNLLVEISLDGIDWSGDLAGPYIRIVYLPLDANGQLSLNGLFRDVRLNGENTQGWNAVFDDLNLAPGEISVWYYERAETLVTKQNWDDAFFFAPPLNVSFVEEMTPIHFADFWNFAAEPFTRLLGRFRQTAVRYWTQPTQTTWQPVPAGLY